MGRKCGGGSVYDGGSDDEAGGEPSFLRFFEQGFTGQGVFSQPNGAVEGFPPTSEGGGPGS